jgi:hypothetical protein
MTLKSYLWGMRIGAILSFASWILVLLLVDPEKSGIFGEILFLTSTFLFLAALLVLFFTWLRKNLSGGPEGALICLSVSFRQGILMAMMVVLLLILQEQRILIWWDGALVVAGVLLIELYFLTRR